MKNQAIPIFFAVDDNFAPFLAASLVSVLDNTKSFIEAHVLDGGITNESKSKIEELKKEFDNFSIEYITIDLEKEFGDFPVDYTYHSLNTFSRYLIAELKPELNKAIYLDADIIVMGDLAELYNQDLEGYFVGAIPEYTDVLDQHKKDLKLSERHQYFNAGVLLLDCEQFRKNNLKEVFIKKTFEIRPKLLDQDIFNVYFQNNYKVLNYKYNVSDYMRKYNQIKFNQVVQEALDNPFALHYSTFKPWKQENVPEEKYFWKYMKKTAFYEVVLNNKIKELEGSESLKKKIESQRQELVNLRNSKTFKVGDLFFRSIKNPWKLITFPVNLIKILINK